MIIRSATENDYHSIIDIHNSQNIPWPEKANTEQALRTIDTNRSKDSFCRRWIAEKNKTAIGFCSCVEGSPYNNKKTYLVEISVLKEFQHQGFGTQLFKTMLQTIEKLGSSLLCADSFSIYPYGNYFLTKVGFHETWKETPVVLEVSNARVSSYEKDLLALEKKGFSFQTVADLSSDPTRNERLYQLYIKLDQTVPSESTFIYKAPSFEDWYESQIEDPNILLDAYQVILKDNQMIGLKEVGMGNTKGTIACGLMGVLPEFRRHGLGRIMQIKTIEYAKQIGCTTLKSCTATKNLPMQNLYSSLGYIQLYEWTQHMMEVQ